MKLLLFIFIGFSLFCFSQQETKNWAISPNAKLQFNSGSVSLIPNSTVADFFESSSCISDENGNLLFYSDGETVWGADNNVLPNGNNLSPINNAYMGTCTQGSLFIQKPGSDDLYYLFSLSPIYDVFVKSLSYSLIDKTLNGGIGEVVSSNNLLITTDTLSEKMTATKHCNNTDMWLVVVKYNNLSFQHPSDYSLEFLSYLITQDGLQSSPIKSSINAICPLIGQMKFNNAKNELALADNNNLILFSFDNSTGMITLKETIPLPLKNGYGLEYAPNDSLIYINEKQYDFQTGTLTKLVNYDSPSQLQRGLDNQIYIRMLPDPEINIDLNALGFHSNNWFLSGNTDNLSHTSVINAPNMSGTGCNLLLEEYNVLSPGNFQNYISLPHFPSYHFNHKPSEFGYTGTCAGEIFDFFLVNNPTADSVHWLFHETDTELQGTTAQYTYLASGEYQVTCTVYQNGVASISTQCVSVCGENDVNIPSSIDLCYSNPQEINALNTCSASYLWNTGDTTSAIFIEINGTYILETTNTCGVFYDTIDVYKSDDCNLLTEIPNVITANSDGVNDSFSIQVKNAKAFNYSIVNRWGNVIKQGEVSINAPLYWNTFVLWDGKTINENNVEDGTYFYIIDFELINGSTKSQNGFIQVVN